MSSSVDPTLAIARNGADDGKESQVGCDVDEDDNAVQSDVCGILFEDDGGEEIPHVRHIAKDEDESHGHPPREVVQVVVILRIVFAGQGSCRELQGPLLRRHIGNAGVELHVGREEIRNGRVQIGIRVLEQVGEAGNVTVRRVPA